MRADVTLMLIMTCYLCRPAAGKEPEVAAPGGIGPVGFVVTESGEPVHERWPTFDACVVDVDLSDGVISETELLDCPDWIADRLVRMLAESRWGTTADRRDASGWVRITVEEHRGVLTIITQLPVMHPRPLQVQLPPSVRVPEGCRVRLIVEASGTLTHLRFEGCPATVRRAASEVLRDVLWSPWIHDGVPTPLQVELPIRRK